MFINDSDSSFIDSRYEENQGQIITNIKFLSN